MIIHGKDICIDGDYKSMSSNNYFESIIENCIQFFDRYLYTRMSYKEFCHYEIDRILREPDRTNNLGRLIYSTYYNMKSKFKPEDEIRDFICDQFFDYSTPTPTDDQISALYYDKMDLHRALEFKGMHIKYGTDHVSYKKLEGFINNWPISIGSNYDFSRIDIPCMVYRNADFDIKPHVLYQVAMSYDAIILTHNVPNEKYWEIHPVQVGDKQYTDLEECINALPEKNILVLSCNDNGHTIKDIPYKTINIPRYGLISELYIEK